MSETPTRVRCAWANAYPIFTTYHDEEWGIPVHDDRLLFEMLNLRGAQTGLMWLTVLEKREHYRQVFANFEADKIAQFDQVYLESLREDAGIVRNRLKIHAVRDNARAFLEVQKKFGSFDQYIWSFTEGKRMPHERREEALLISERMSKALSDRGFRFVNPTICFAFMQSVGMLNDHEKTCYKHP